MGKLEEKIEIATVYGLFDTQACFTQENQVFDSYGNYFFPTDFSDKVENTITTINTKQYIINKTE